MKEKFERRKRIERRRGERGSWGEKFERRSNLISKGKKKEDDKNEEERKVEGEI